MNPFDGALEEAIGIARRRSLVLGGVATVLSLGLGAGLYLTVESLQAAWTLLAVPLVWIGLQRGTQSTRALVLLRGSQPEHWVASPSHGVLVATPQHLVGAGLPAAELNRHARCRVTSISYDESAHLLTVDVTVIVETDEGEQEHASRSKVKLPSTVTPERAFAFARHVLQQSQR